MIQSLVTKTIDPKAAAKVSAKALGKAAGEAEADPESMIEGADFANELMASLSADETNPQVKPVEVSAEQLLKSPSLLNQLPATNPDTINPKVFDPSLTQGVDKIVQPKTTDVPMVEGQPVALTDEQVLKLAQGQANPVANAEIEGEISQAMLKNPQVSQAPQGLQTQEVAVEGEFSQVMLKTPQVQEAPVAQTAQAQMQTTSAQVGRSPALDMSKPEIDSKLMNMEDFVAQKNLAVKKSLNNTSAYGMPQKATGKVGADTGLKSTQTVNEIGATESGTKGAGTAVNSQQFILSAQADLGANAKMNEAQAPMKTFNMSHIKTDNPNQIMTQITDYIVQAKAAKEPTVNMRVNHDTLGMIDITVNKLATGQDAIAINIGAHSVDGKNFFQTNSKDLFSHLTSSGLNISDIKVETPSHTAKNEFDFGQQSSRGGSNPERQFGSEQNQKRQDSERRQDLWNLLRDKEAA